MLSRVDQLRRRLRHVYWLGGGSGGGKSTVARLLAMRHGLHVYSTDDAMADHASRCGPKDGPLLAAFKAMDMDERWVDRSAEVMLETFHWFRGEAFDLIIEDLMRLPPEAPVIVEGFRLLPRLVEPLLGRPNQALWLIPTPAFRLAALKSRGTLWSIAGKTAQPDRALENLLLRDQMFTARLEEEAEALGLAVIKPDASVSEDDLADRVALRLGF